MTVKTVALAGILAATAMLPVQAATTAVDLELALLVDVSGSVDTNEYNLQLGGYISAFNSAVVQNAILGGTLGKIAVSYVQWSGSTDQQQTIGWTLIDSIPAAQAFATALQNTVRAFASSTAPGSAINWIADAASSSESFSENAFSGSRNVIDVSGDGAENDGASTAAARDFALAHGVDSINGIPILTDDATLDVWYNANIKGGTKGFVIAASSFTDFEDAIEKKLVTEITGGGGGEVPLPGAAWLLVSGLGGIAAIRRRKSA